MLIAGNWKMFKGPAEAGEFCRALRDAALPDDVDVVVAPPYVSLASAVQALAGTEIGVFAQNCHWDAEGAFTLHARPGSALLICSAPGYRPRAETVTVGAGGVRHDVVLEPSDRTARTPVAGS